MSGVTAGDPARPVITAYAGDDRTELSAATLANAVAKNANLLVDGCGQPLTVGLLLPPCWQALPLALAGVEAGATVLPETTGEVTFCAVPGAPPAGEAYWVSLHPLGLPGPVPPGYLDHAREVAGFADRFTAPGPRGQVAGVSASPAGGERVLLVPTTLRELVTHALPVLWAGGSVVVVTGPEARERAAGLADLEQARAAGPEPGSR